MPKRPMTTDSSSTPSSRYTLPNVRRGVPATGSSPTSASSAPKTVMMRALTIDRPARPVAMESPTIISAKYSGGPA